jgi:DNA-binding NarL/FixJ family response regulator
MGAAAAPGVVLADGHPTTRLGVRMALLNGGFSVLAEAADCAGAVRAVAARRPDVCLLDAATPGDVIQAARMIAAESPSTKLVMLGSTHLIDDVLAALRAGVVGYLPKNTRPDRLPNALRGVLKGEVAMPRALVSTLLQELRMFTAPPAEPIRIGEVELSPRESEVLRLLNSGLSTTEVGAQLSLSPVTVRRHISAVMAKLGVADRGAAMRAVELAA